MATSELLHLRDPKFHPDLLEYVKQDPVHDYNERPIDLRTREDKNIFFLSINGGIVGVLCVAFTTSLPTNITAIFDTSDASIQLKDATHAIFYSVFRTDVPTKVKNVGSELINTAAKWIQDNLPNVTNYVTMSPIPTLSRHFKEPPEQEDEILQLLERGKDPVAKFHLSNGARVYRVIPNADSSKKRQEQSWGWMANYHYTSANP